ncbi:MAG: glycosyltransferase WbuB, partial [bacterium]
MKIIYLHQYYHNPQMSGSTRSYEMARRLVNMGHEVHLVTS